MTSNDGIGRLREVAVVGDFAAKHKMTDVVCDKSDEYSYLLFRYPFFIEFRDYLIENYLEVIFSDLKDNLLLPGSVALGCSLDLGLQDLVVLRSHSFDEHPLNEIFLSHKAIKMRNLHSFLGAIDALLPLVEAKGLSSMQNGTFDPRFDFSQAVSPLYPGLRERYLACMR